MRHIKSLAIVFLFVLVCQVLSFESNEKDYSEIVNKLRQDIQQNDSIFHHSAYNRLAYISDTYGPRLWGSNQLQQVIYEVQSMAKSQGFDNVHLQKVGPFTRWIRGKEELTLYSPRATPTKLKLIGLGGSVPGRVKAEAIVVSSFDQLDSVRDRVKNKIVVYNEQWTTYGNSVQYRSAGASRAAKYGAVAALVRSVTPVSIYSVHTGIQHYADENNKIPVAAITVQDARMFARMQKRNQTIVLEINMESKVEQNAYSNNVIFQIRGLTKPDQILLMGGHIDSWDTGSQTGANDDAGGFITCFQAMRLILKNQLKPKRTIRFIAWSGEEWGDPNNGARNYAAAHANQLNKHIVAFEDDLGSTQLLGFGYSGSAEGKKVVQMIADKYLTLINANMTSDNGQAVDTGPLREKGVPTMINLIKDTDDHQYYFTYHHSAGDSMTMMSPDQLDSNVLGVACMFYILADLEQTIPRIDYVKQSLFSLRTHS